MNILVDYDERQTAFQFFIDTKEEAEQMRESLVYQRLLEILPEKVCLTYTDGDSSFKDSQLDILKAIQSQDLYSLYDSFDEWISDEQWNNIFELCKEDDFLETICEGFDLDYKEDAEDFVDRWHQEINDILYERDTSDPFGEMLDNTSDVVVSYRLTDEDIRWNFFGQEETRDEIKEIKRALCLPIRDTTYDKKLEQMLIQGGGGGLYIFFNIDGDTIKELCNLKERGLDKITFKNPNVGLVDYFNGAGDDCCLKGHEFSVKFNLDMIDLDKTNSYDYTHVICGRSDYCCDDTIVTFGKYRKSSKGD